MKAFIGINMEILAKNKIKGDNTYENNRSSKKNR